MLESANKIEFITSLNSIFEMEIKDIALNNNTWVFSFNSHENASEFQTRIFTFLGLYTQPTSSTKSKLVEFQSEILEQLAENLGIELPNVSTHISLASNSSSFREYQNMPSSLSNMDHPDEVAVHNLNSYDADSDNFIYTDDKDNQSYLGISPKNVDSSTERSETSYSNFLQGARRAKDAFEVGTLINTMTAHDNNIYNTSIPNNFLDSSKSNQSRFNKWDSIIKLSEFFKVQISDITYNKSSSTLTICILGDCSNIYQYCTGATIRFSNEETSLIADFKYFAKVFHSLGLDPHELLPNFDTEPSKGQPTSTAATMTTTTSSTTSIQIPEEKEKEKEKDEKRSVSSIIKNSSPTRDPNWPGMDSNNPAICDINRMFGCHLSRISKDCEYLNFKFRNFANIGCFSSLLKLKIVDWDDYSVIFPISEVKTLLDELILKGMSREGSKAISLIAFS